MEAELSSLLDKHGVATEVQNKFLAHDIGITSIGQSSKAAADEADFCAVCI